MKQYQHLNKEERFYIWNALRRNKGVKYHLMVEPDPVPLIFDSRVRTVDRAVSLRELSHG